MSNQSDSAANRPAANKASATSIRRGIGGLFANGTFSPPHKRIDSRGLMLDLLGQVRGHIMHELAKRVWSWKRIRRCQTDRNQTLHGRTRPTVYGR